MALRFRKSFKLGPGVRLNIGKKSKSLSFGGRGPRSQQRPHRHRDPRRSGRCAVAFRSVACAVADQPAGGRGSEGACEPGAGAAGFIVGGLSKAPRLGSWACSCVSAFGSADGVREDAFIARVNFTRHPFVKRGWSGSTSLSRPS